MTEFAMFQGDKAFGADRLRSDLDDRGALFAIAVSHIELEHSNRLASIASFTYGIPTTNLGEK